MIYDRIIDKGMLFSTGPESLLSSVAQQLWLVESVSPDRGQRHEQDRGGDRSHSAFH